MTMSIASLADQMHLEEVYHLVKELGIQNSFLAGQTFKHIDMLRPTQPNDWLPSVSGFLLNSTNMMNLGMMGAW